VALLDRREREHARCMEALLGLTGRLITTEVVLTETLWLVSGVRVNVVVENMFTPTPVKVTLQQYLALPETALPHELVEGELRLTAAPSMWHQTVLNRLARPLEDFVESCKLGFVFRAPVDVILNRAAGLVLQPDIIYIRQDRTVIVRERIEGAPDLVVEILSPGTRDYDCIEKSARYATAGVAEYWLADSEIGAIEIRRLDQRPPLTIAVFTTSDSLTSPLLPGLALPLAPIFTR
jgi:Uma2 family endonuclease